MRSTLWLSDPTTGQKLQAITKLVVGACIVWAAVMAYSFYDFNDSVAQASADLDSKKKILTELTSHVRQDRADAGNAKVLMTNPPDGPATAQFSKELQLACTSARTVLRELRYSPEGPQAPAPPPTNDGKPAADTGSPQNGASVVVSSSAPKDAAADGKWKSIGFETKITGHFRDVVGFLDGLKAMPRVVEIDSIQLSRGAVTAVNRDVQVDLILKGHLFGLAGK